jgi:thiamine transport system substrate-binding protein
MPAKGSRIAFYWAHANLELVGVLPFWRSVEMSKIVAVIVAVAIGVAACRGPDQPTELVIMTHSSFDIGQEVIDAFEEQHKVKLTFLDSGDAGEALNKAILSKNNPLADVFYGADNTFLSRALKEDIFEPYESPALSDIALELMLDESHRLLPVDWGDVCLNYDKAWFEEKELPPPDSLEALIDPAYAGLTVVQNPATSSPGLAFLLATVDHFGADGWQAYWRALRENGVWVENGWTEAYYGQFSAASDGDRPIVVSYATSPAAEVYYSEGKYTTPPTGAVTTPGTCFRQVEFVGILKGTKRLKLAQAFVDWMLGQAFQEDIPLHMWVFPANQEAGLPQLFADFAQQAQDPASTGYEEIAEHRDEWIATWTEIVLH